MARHGEAYSKVVVILVDNGEPTLTKSIESLRNQTVKCDIILAPGPNSDLELARPLVDVVMPPTIGIGRSRVNAILQNDAEYIVSCDSDCLYDKRYIEFAVEDLEAGMRAVKAGIILPFEWKEPLTLVETALSLIPPYEYALCFRREDFLRAGIVEEAERYGADRRWDIGGAVVTRLNAWPDFRMKVLTRMPTKGAWGFVENYAVPLLAGTVPLAITAGVVGASRLLNSLPKLVQRGVA